ncbi:MAG: hypothetical protein ACREIV_10900, partial [Planctomycetaceae bacterium]
MPDPDPTPMHEGGPRLTRRQLLRAGATGAAGAAVTLAAGVPLGSQQANGRNDLAAARSVHPAHTGGPVRTVDSSILDPIALLTEFDTGVVSRMPDGRVLREFEMVAVDREIEVTAGVRFPAWTY